MLSYLVYVSQRNSTCTQEEIDKILAACERNNSHSDATGVLLYSDTKFVQYLEGNYKSIIALYDKIKKDPRHKNVVLVQMGQTEKRLFPSWQMGSKKFSENKITFSTQLNEEDSAIFRNILDGREQTGNQSLSLIQNFFN
ncbi:BLUF domain-containing protein [Fulvivirga sedimenti]|uniref:BLUF domain-containing protein n=1 Tax=Fulvivirga sedimenti TaxID=2879465 RepID=A0A9X1KZA6_9BACT|nr:BLUF domain-containing protein [Fulvivirga sedimenti]MCA6078708.1 BLUF domain-containing protein [Fulvivirga sedimenti]